jgi:hypothetical protein
MSWTSDVDLASWPLRSRRRVCRLIRLRTRRIRWSIANLGSERQIASNTSRGCFSPVEAGKFEIHLLFAHVTMVTVGLATLFPVTLSGNDCDHRIDTPV